MSKTVPQIKFHFLSPCSLSARQTLKPFLISVFHKEKRELKSLDIIFCSDHYILSLNRKFLSHDFYTDILSFPLSDGNDPLVAEIYISVDRVRENAKTAKTSFKEEIHRVIFHGVLHFCGYKDKSPGEIKKMRMKENQLLLKYFGD
jgi:probable rRNA maturation factor